MITFDNWPDNFTDLPVGTEISEEVYQHFLNILPPIRLRESRFVGFQSSEPHSHEWTEQGFYAPTYMTFVRKDGKFFYVGTNFRETCLWDGTRP